MVWENAVTAAALFDEIAFLDNLPQGAASSLFLSALFLSPSDESFFFLNKQKKDRDPLFDHFGQAENSWKLLCPLALAGASTLVRVEDTSISCHPRQIRNHGPPAGKLTSIAKWLRQRASCFPPFPLKSYHPNSKRLSSSSMI